MIKFIVIALGIFIAYKLFANDFLHKKKSNDQQNQKETEKKAASGEVVKDPICGTYVSISDSISVKDGQNIHRFCSYECRDTFLKKLEAQRQIEPSSEEDSSSKSQE